MFFVFFKPGNGGRELLHGAIEGDVLEDLQPGEEHIDGEDIVLHLGPIGEGGEVAMEGGLGEQGLEQLLDDDVGVDSDPATEERDNDHQDVHHVPGFVEVIQLNLFAGWLI